MKVVWPRHLKPKHLPQLHSILLDWFDRHHRPLPWRINRDPYRIWVSEVMLQQTTVSAVGPFFERFLSAFPKLESLAAAQLEDVLKLWEGLGYYRRARHLHQAAQLLWQEYGGQWPTDPHIWQKLPGIGPYMLGAILSQAFDLRMPIVEANSLRVLARWFAFRDDPREGSGKKWVWAAAEAVLPQQRVGDFNQALMELGAQVCKIDRPNCGECPVQEWCAANQQSLQAEIPVPPKAKQTQEVQEVALLIRRGNQVLIVKRPATATRWANLWEWPKRELMPDESVDQCAERLLQDELGLRGQLLGERTTITYAVTRFRIKLHCWEMLSPHGEPKLGYYAESHWVTPAELAEYPTNSPQRKLWKEFAQSGHQLRLF